MKERISWLLVAVLVGVGSWTAGERHADAKSAPVISSLRSMMTSDGATLAALMRNANTTQPCKPDYQYNPITQKLDPVK